MSQSWQDKLFGGFRRTSDKLGENLTGLFTKAALDRQTLDEIASVLKRAGAARVVNWVVARTFPPADV